MQYKACGNVLTRHIRIAETLPEDILELMRAPPKPDIPVIEPADLVNYDAMLLGIPTRFGNFPVQWKAFWDKTGPEWQKSAFWGKFVGTFVTTSILGGGQESTAMSAMSTFAHHGLIYVPMGYKGSSHIQAKLDQARGGSAWGAGSLTVCGRPLLSIVDINNPSPTIELIEDPIHCPGPRRFATTFR